MTLQQSNTETMSGAATLYSTTPSVGTAYFVSNTYPSSGTAQLTPGYYVQSVQHHIYSGPCGISGSNTGLQTTPGSWTAYVWNETSGSFPNTVLTAGQPPTGQYLPPTVLE